MIIAYIADMLAACAVQDFQNVIKAPGRVMLGAVLQYTIMPLMGFVVSRLAGLPTPFAIG